VTGVSNTMKTCVVSSESLTILDKHKNRMQAGEMKYLRKVNGKTRRDQIRNTTIRPGLTSCVAPSLFR
jgi:hypothetical protein